MVLYFQRRDLDISMLEHSCGVEDEKMKTIYEMNYSNKGKISSIIFMLGMYKIIFHTTIVRLFITM